MGILRELFTDSITIGGITADVGLEGPVQTQKLTAEDLIDAKALGAQRYRILTKQDEKVCGICRYMEEVGSFRVIDALALVGMYEDADLETDLQDISPWLTLDDVDADTDVPPILGGDGLGVRALTKRGAILPPFHGKCRCDIALIE